MNPQGKTDYRAAAALLATAAAAFLLSQVPLLSAPFEWFETYFHEISHGVAALLTGGDVLQLELRLDGSGTLTHAGAWLPAVVSFAGYAGSFVFGCMLYLAASASAPQSAGRWGLGLAAMVGVSVALWVRDVQSLLVCAVLAAAFLGLWRLGGSRLTQWLIQFIACYVVVSAFASPVWLLWADGGHSDAASLRKATGIPELVWIGAWLLVGAVMVRWAVRVVVSGRAAEWRRQIEAAG